MMVNTLAQVEHFAATTPNPHQGGTWNQKCEQFVNNAADFGPSETFTTAYKAARASGHLDPNHATAKPGEFHYWSGGVENAGHVAFQTSRGLLMASNSLPYPYTGYISWAAFAAAKPEFKYLGHTYRHGTKRLAGLVIESTGHVIVLPSLTHNTLEIAMLVRYKKAGSYSYWLIGELTSQDVTGHHSYYTSAGLKLKTMKTEAGVLQLIADSKTRAASLKA